MPRKILKSVSDIGPPDPQVVRANINREMVQAGEFVSLYTNDTQIEITPWDFRFIFGVISSPPTKDQPIPTITIRTIGEARMSPQHAKKVLAVLERQIKNYEENVGPIPTPAD